MAFVAVCALIAVAPQASSAAVALALPRAEYPNGAKIVAVPATNANADRYLHPAHRSSFDALHRIDGAGWLQFGSWHFVTGVKSGRVNHSVRFGYGINLFPQVAEAWRALHDVKLKTVASHDVHISTRRYLSVTANGTLIFIFFVYAHVEVEAYYEFNGAAPRAVSHRLRHVFLRQEARLIALAKHLSRTPKPTATPVPTATETPVPSPTATSVPTATLPATGTPTAVPTDTPTATIVPVNLNVTAVPAQGIYAPGERAVIDVHVANNGVPLANASVNGLFQFYEQSGTCAAVTNLNGDAVCSVIVPVTEPVGTVRVVVEASGTRGAPVDTTTTFQVGTH